MCLLQRNIVTSICKDDMINKKLLIGSLQLLRHTLMISICLACDLLKSINTRQSREWCSVLEKKE